MGRIAWIPYDCLLEGEIPLGTHPLIERSQLREVRQAKGFREAAAALTGEGLAAEYKQEQACSFCDESGHNRRSCPKRKEEEAEAV